MIWGARGNIRVLITILVLNLRVRALPGDTLDRDESSRGSSGHNLIELLTLLEVDRPHLDLPAQIPGDLLYRVASDTLDDVLRVRNDQRSFLALVLDGQKPRRRELVDVRAGLRVQVQRDAVALLPRRFGVDQDRRVVTADLRRSGTLWCCAVEVFEDETVNGVDAMVDADGEDVDLASHKSGHAAPPPHDP
jgi:hypothetical protein